jgi:hypothetical protein
MKSLSRQPGILFFLLINFCFIVETKLTTMEENSQTTLFDLHVDHESTSYLGEAAKWTKFLSIIGFIFCFLIIIVAFFVGAIFSSPVMDRYGGTASAIGAGSITLIYILIGLLYFFPCLYLFNFSTKMQAALRNNDQTQLNQSFKNLKSCFKYMGILTIIIIAIYLLVIIVAVVARSSFR